MRLGVVGSRNWPIPGAVANAVSRYQALGFDTVVSGGARGVDTSAENSGRVLGMGVVSFRVFDRHDGWFGVEKWTWSPRDERWDMEPVMRGSRPAAFRSFASAAFWRNGLIVPYSDGVVALWDGRSNGTRDSIERAEREGNLLEVIRSA